ncbi:hypothetical protein ABT236_35155 [Streptomyces sp. NPDC001523]|uniref:hypothetical protein n=1 Tax=Streptomyces sp. NPDC001523 TaxID=3154383 RepID=UPI003332F979
MPDTSPAHLPRSRPAVRLAGPQGGGWPRGCLTAVAYEAFCATHHTVYARYAATRLGSVRAGVEAAATALDALASLWASALTCPAPAAVSWQLLTDLVDARARDGRALRGLSGPQADAMILRGHLGLSGQEAAAAMGLPVCEFAMLHRAALRTPGP